METGTATTVRRPAGPRLYRNESVDFRGLRRGDTTQRSSTDPEARLCRRGGMGAYLSLSMHAMTENRHGQVVAVAVREANDMSERECALRMVKRVRNRHRMNVATLGADAGYDVGEFL